MKANVNMTGRTSAGRIGCIGTMALFATMSMGSAQEPAISARAGISYTILPWDE